MEWIAPDGERKIRTCLESCRIAEAYDRFYPLPKGERKKQEYTQDEGQKQELQPAPEQEQEQEQRQQQEQKPASEQPPQLSEPPQEQPEHPQPEITPHRDIYFYLHRPRTATKQPVLIPLAPSSTLTTALRRRTVLEFPTIYVLPDSPDTIRTAEGFLLEDDYLQSGGVDEETTAGDPAGTIDGEAQAQSESQLASNAADLEHVDEAKVLEVLKQDLFEPVPAAAE